MSESYYYGLIVGAVVFIISMIVIFIKTKTCPHCGAVVKKSVRICPKCHRSILPGWKFK